MMITSKLALFVLVGAALGGALGYYGKCTSGTCPLTANPWRGGLYGAFIGLMLGMSAPRSTSSTDGGQATVPSPFISHATTPAEFEAEVIASDLPVLVDFYADWCGPCRALAPSLADLAEEQQGRLKVVKVNVDQAGELARTHKVSSIPDLRLFIGGSEVDRMVGAPGKAALRAFARVEPDIAEGGSKK